MASAMSTWRWKENATSEAVSSLPFAKVRPSLMTTVYSVGAVNSAETAMSGSGSGLSVPGMVFTRNG